uniref:Uncharacterized protein n=1 Tax=Arundo donax TaxID=35708 RepID=A0A0A9B3R4_ARUDO
MKWKLNSWIQSRNICQKLAYDIIIITPCLLLV